MSGGALSATSQQFRSGGQHAARAQPPIIGEGGGYLETPQPKDCKKSAKIDANGVFRLLSPLNLDLIELLGQDRLRKSGGYGLAASESHLSPDGNDLSACPVFVDAQECRLLAEPVTSNLIRIFHAALRARFSHDNASFAAYFGRPFALNDLLQAHPIDPRDVFGRYDTVFDDDGLKLLGLRIGASACDWLCGNWTQSTIRDLLAEDPRSTAWGGGHDTIIERLFDFLIDSMRRLNGARRGGHVLFNAIAWPETERPALHARLQQVYDCRKPLDWPAGQVFLLTDYAEITFPSNGDVRFGGQRMDAMVLAFPPTGDVPVSVIDALTAAHLYGDMAFPDCPLHTLLGDRRLLALLHDCLLAGQLAPLDAAIVERHVPWTVRVVPGAVERNGKNAALSVLLDRDRRSLVLKRASPSGGRTAVIGRATSNADWVIAVERAFEEGDWIAQEFCASAQRLSRAPENGLAARECIWMLFAFGGAYAGALARARRAASTEDYVTKDTGSATEFAVIKDSSDTTQDEYSPLNGRLMRAIEGDPTMRAERIDLDSTDTEEFLRGSGLKISPWPLFVDKDFARRRFGTIVEAIPRILYKAITAYFGDDARAFSEYLGRPRVLYDLLKHAPVDPRDLNARYDTSVTADSVRILEINCSSSAGGFHEDWIEPHNTRILRRHATTAAWRVRRHGVLRSQFQALIASMLRRRGGSACGHILMYAFTPNSSIERLQTILQAVYDEVRPPELADGRIHLFNDFSRITFDRSGDVRYAGHPIDTVLFTFSDHIDVPKHVYRRLTEAYLGRGLVFPDSPLHQLLDNKMQLALVHEACELGLLDADERTIVRDCIPWTSILCEREVEWRGERSSLSRLLLSERERFVLKKGASFGGRDVIVGRHCDGQEWRVLLKQHMEDRDWLAQEYCQPGRALLHDPAHGLCEYDLIWGVFTYGGRYGGTFLRGKPTQGTDGVINLGTGATGILVYAETE